MTDNRVGTRGNNLLLVHDLDGGAGKGVGSKHKKHDKKTQGHNYFGNEAGEGR